MDFPMEEPVSRMTDSRVLSRAACVKFTNHTILNAGYTLVEVGMVLIGKFIETSDGEVPDTVISCTSKGTPCLDGFYFGLVWLV